MRIDISDGVDGVQIKVLTTNSTSITLLPDPKFEGKVVQPTTSANRVSAEHGLAMSITIMDGDEKHLFLLDVGGLMETVIENSKQLGVKLGEVEKVILSHGHFDHFGSFPKVIPLLKEGCEFYLSPICYEQNHVVFKHPGGEIDLNDFPASIRKIKKEGNLIAHRKLPPLNKNLLTNLAEQNNLKIIETMEPVKLHKGIATSGTIELFDENETSKGFYLPKSKKEFEKHTFKDETSIYINIKDKGLIIVTGCGHTGIINTIKHAQKLTGINKIYAVIGGFHKEYETPENIEKAAKFIGDLNPDVICGMHCTGFGFNKLMSEHPSHTLGIVGTEFNL